jgi:hypothetical protein
MARISSKLSSALQQLLAAPISYRDGLDEVERRHEGSSMRAEHGSRVSALIF